jgi:hypothetical protein
MATKYFENVRKSTTVDSATGEVTEMITHTTDVFRRADGEGGFVKLYLDDLAKLNKVQHKAILVLFELVKIMDYDNEISVSIGKKKSICESLDIYNLVEGVKVLGTNIVDQHITKLVKAGLLARKDKGMYIANPQLFGKGRWTDVKKIRMSVEYSQDGRLIMSNIEKK